MLQRLRPMVADPPAPATRNRTCVSVPHVLEGDPSLLHALDQAEPIIAISRSHVCPGHPLQGSQRVDPKPFPPRTAFGVSWVADTPFDFMVRTVSIEDR